MKDWFAERGNALFAMKCANEDDFVRLATLRIGVPERVWSA